MTLEDTEDQSKVVQSHYHNFINALNNYVNHLNTIKPQQPDQLDQLTNQFTSDLTFKTDIQQILEKISNQFPKMELESIPPKSMDYNSTYQLIFDFKLPECAKPSLVYLLVTLGFQIDHYETIMGSFMVECRYRGLPQRVLSEIKDAPVAVQLLSGYRDEGKEVHPHDRLYHVEMDVSKESWDWSWAILKYVPALTTVLID